MTSTIRFYRIAATAACITSFGLTACLIALFDAQAVIA